MNTKAKTMFITAGLAIGLAAMPTLAQVAPPPTKPAKEIPTYTPPTPPSAPSAQKPQPIQSAKPTPPKPKATKGKKDRGDVSDLPINVPYPKLAQKGPDGRILRLRQLPDILALRSNPNVGPKSVEKIMPVVYSRRYRLELMVIDNLDLYWALTDGMIENFDISDITEMGRIAEMLKPLVPSTTLSQQLLNLGILTRVQGEMNQYIVREYKKAVTDEIQVLEGENGLEQVMRFVLDDSILEARITYNAMLAEAISEISGLVDETGATSPEAQALSALEKELVADPEQQFNDLNEFDAAFRNLSFDESTAILKAMRERREFPEISPTVAKINVLHEYKKVTDKGFGAIITNPKTGEVIDTRNRDEDGKVIRGNKRGGTPLNENKKED